MIIMIMIMVFIMIMAVIMIKQAWLHPRGTKRVSEMVKAGKTFGADDNSVGYMHRQRSRSYWMPAYASQSNWTRPYLLGIRHELLPSPIPTYHKGRVIHAWLPDEEPLRHRFRLLCNDVQDNASLAGQITWYLFMYCLAVWCPSWEGGQHSAAQVHSCALGVHIQVQVRV